MVNMLQISSSKNPGGEKLDDIAFNFVLTLLHQKLYMRNLKRKNSHKKRVQCIIYPNIIHQKTPSGKMDDIT